MGVRVGRTQVVEEAMVQCIGVEPCPLLPVWWDRGGVLNVLAGIEQHLYW